MDISYLLWLQDIRTSSPAFVQAFFAFLGSDAATLVILVVPCVAYWCLNKRYGLVALMAYGCSWLSNQLLKNTVCCYRPWVRDPRVIPEPSAIEGASGYSFPSGHTQSSASMLGGLGWMWRSRRWPMIAGLVFTVLIGFSRNFLGVHTPQDVLVGMVEGYAFVLLADRFAPWVDAQDKRDVQVMAAGIVAVVVFLVYATIKPYPLDYVDGKLLVDPAEMLIDCYKLGGGGIGLFVGWFVERRYVRFSTDDVSVREGALRMLVGLVLLLLVYEPIGHALVDTIGPYAGQFLRFLTSFILAIAVVPMSFGPIRAWLDARISSQQV